VTSELAVDVLPVVAALVGVLGLWYTVRSGTTAAVNGKVEKSEARIRSQMADDALRDEKHQDTLTVLLASVDERLRRIESSETLHRHTGFTYAMAQDSSLRRWSDQMAERDPDWPRYSGPHPHGFEDGMKGRV
jgi:hypothetical protein